MVRNTPVLLSTSSSGQKISVEVVERRRYYGRQTFCYCGLTVDGINVDSYVDSPWPAVNYPRAAIVWAIRSSGFDIPVTPRDITWAKKMHRERRIFAMSLADQEQYLGIK